MTTLQLSNALLRPWAHDDAQALVRNANNWHIARNMRDIFPHPYTAADASDWLNRVVDQEPVTNFAIEVDREAAGGISVHLGDDVYRRTAEIGYWLAEPHWGKGIVTEVVEAAVAYVFGTFDIVRIEAVVWEWNPASMRVLEKAGFTREATLRRAITKDGRTVDAELFAVIRDG
ncbi:MAG TPA: GNAT family protein [Tepidiformaceae bacterium]|nr:GNAT family protein [Tepidiformaceae bacterium]